MNTVSIEQLKRNLNEGRCKLVDVRSASEFSSGHVPGSINIPLEQIESRMADLGDASLLLICQSGQRAKMAAERLRRCGAEISVVEGGTQAWK